jgi:hypothetical protein
MSKRTTKDKPKEKFDGVVLKKSTVTTTTTSTIRQPLKAVTGGAPQSRKAVISVSEQVQQLEQIHEDIPAGSDPMASTSRIASRRSSSRPSPSALCLHVNSSSPWTKWTRKNPARREEASYVVRFTRGGGNCGAHSTGRGRGVPVAHPKRSTTPEADPDGDQWDDLDAEDTDDPLMVSEYVTKSSRTLKRLRLVNRQPYLFYHLFQSFRKRPCLTPTIWRCKRISRGRCGAS